MIEYFANPITLGLLKTISQPLLDKLHDVFCSQRANINARKHIEADWIDKLKNVYILESFIISSKDISSIYNKSNSETFIKTLRSKLFNITKKWKEIDLDDKTRYQLVDDYINWIIIYFIGNHEGIAHLILNNQLNEFKNLIESIFKHYTDFKNFIGLHEKITQQINSSLPDKDLFSNNLMFFTNTEKLIKERISQILKKANHALLIGEPASGKTVFSLSVALDLFKDGYHVFYYRIRNQSDSNNVFNELVNNDRENFIFIFDNCHHNTGFTIDILERINNLKNSSCLFISRDIAKKIRCTDEDDFIDYYELFEKRIFEIGFKDKKEFLNKVCGIVDNYQRYFENKYKTNLRIGDFPKVVGNCHKNLLTLYYNLVQWPKVKILSEVEKQSIYKNLYDCYLNKNRDLILKIASLYQYEIPYKPNQNEEKDVEELLKKGILQFDSEFYNYYFYHSEFAKLLLLSFESNYDFYRLHGNLEDYSYHNIELYIHEYDPYPPNLEELFHTLVRFGSGLNTLRKLIRKHEIRAKIALYYSRCGSIVKLLFILYRLQNVDYKIVKDIIQNIPDKIWIEKLLELRISGLAYCLKCLNDTYPEKAQHLIKQLDTQDIIDRSLSSSIVCISNALVELNSILPKHHLGANVLKAFDVEILSKKLENARFEHIGKSLSEFRKVDPFITKRLFFNINVNLIAENAKQVGLKAIGKTLNEIKTIEKYLNILEDMAKSKIILNSIPDTILLSKAGEVGLEGIGRALNELKNIDTSKIIRIFKRIDNKVIIKEIEKIPLLQIGHSLSELNKIDTNKVREIFFQCDSKILAYKITEPGYTINQISYALYQFYKIDQRKIKLKEILSSVQTNYFIKKFKNVDFNKFCISLEYIYKIDRYIVKEVLNAIPFEDVYHKANRESFETLGTSLIKLYHIDCIYAKAIFDKIDWLNKLTSGPTIGFDMFSNTLNHLYIIDSAKTTELYKSINFDFILSIARISSLEKFKQGIRKLRIIDSSLTIKIQTSIIP